MAAVIMAILNKTANPGMPQQLPDGQHGTLCWRILRRVGWVLEHMESLKENPHRVGWICQSTVGEGVGGEQVAEFVVDGWDRYRKEPEQGEPGENRGERHHQERQSLPLGNARCQLFRGSEPAVPEPWRDQCPDDKRNQNHLVKM